MRSFGLLLIAKSICSIGGASLSPYAPEAVGTAPSGNDLGIYTYDEASNRLHNGLSEADEQTIVMGLITKPEKVLQGEPSTSLVYGPGGARYLRVHEDGSKTFYLAGGDFEHRRLGPDAAQSAQNIVNIRVKGYSYTAQVDATNPSDLKYKYLLQDHLGSGLRVVDDRGMEIQTRRYDAWGLMSDAQGTSTHTSRDDESVRGYTGHELLAAAKLNHMNGRLQDPGLGQMLGPDKKINNMGSLTGLNRFSYVASNPLGAIDPSGWTIFVDIGGNMTRMTDHLEYNTQFLHDHPDTRSYNSIKTFKAYQAIDRSVDLGVDSRHLDIRLKYRGADESGAHMFQLTAARSGQRYRAGEFTLKDKYFKNLGDPKNFKATD